MKTMAVTAASAIAVVVLLDIPTSSWYLQASPFTPLRRTPCTHLPWEP